MRNRETSRGINLTRKWAGMKAFFQRANHPIRPIAFWSRAAFEILTDARDHGVEIRV